MKKVIVCGKPELAYTLSDLEDKDFRKTVSDAALEWKDKIKAYSDEHGDVGACVLGAGIYVRFLGPRKRKPSKIRIINPHEICRYQGSCTWEASAAEIVAHLKKQGVVCWFEYGRLD